MSRASLLCAVFLNLACAHGVPTPGAAGPLHVEGSSIKDSTGQLIPLRGAELQTIAAMNSVTFGIMRLHWNFNAVRLPVSSAAWRTGGQEYLNQVSAIVKAANDQGLIAVLANFENGSGLPGPDSLAFWTACSAYFKDTPLVIFDLFNEPSVAGVPGHVAGQRLPADWRFWLNGGTASDGRTVVGMQPLVSAIRSTGATQVIAAPAFHDNLDFQGFGPDYFIQDSNVIYEVHPFFDHALTDADRDRNFGFLARTAPLYAGEWGLILTEDTPACRSIPPNPQQANDLLFQTLAYFDSRGISWTAASFETGSLLRSITTFEPSQLDQPWTCGAIANPEPGMGQVVLLWLTGDPLGFGSIAADLLASAAGGPTGPVAPGEVVAFFGFLFGPPSNVGATLDLSGSLPTSLGGLQVLFDGEPAPLFSVGPFEIMAQVPYSVQNKTDTNVQLVFNQVPTNTIDLTVVEEAPRIVMVLGSTSAADALNQDGSLNSFGNPATAGSVIALFVTGCGQTTPAETTGRIAQPPYAQPTKPISIRIGGAFADVLYAGEAPSSVGLMQVNVRVPDASGGTTRAVPVLLTLGDQASLAGVTIWTR
jgi:uncharacterized protein (TIGR03437 family)